MKAPPLFGGPTWLALVVLALAGAVAAAFIGELKDLLVYQYGGRAVLADQSPYARDDPATGLPFTYPPFAAVLMVPLALLPTWLAAAVWTGASAVALGGSVVVVRRALGRTSPAWLVVVLGVAALAVEPVWQNVTFGQINLLLMLAVLWAIQLRLPGGDPPRRAPMSGGVRLAIYLLAAGMLILGVALFVAPLGAGVLWPWELTPLTGRAVGAWLIGLSAAKLDELARAREVLLHLWIKGFGVRFDEL